ncbi:tRNA pseudouridine(38-40) synthase TruA [Stagnimonas aquatica]|uniref:tRNA pseudouridine synthase A n=1 Tax=Stagnimonas aquatica TaxID=2689987 RepID=A0A3N0UYL8_9GAMM|nr:tRNA pseudouridine(38-40) synthase TruA [Stagnimonas aquatica]ROH85637.1 tRNA pseudouridine(38-40) synthase TruA [Stagnimonas aquatica]
MQRWAARIEYQGAAYAGWQRLAHIRSVQGELEQALGQIAAHPVQVFAAGRTDAGVHGLGQVVHFDSPSTRTPLAWLLGSNVHLPDDIALRWVQPVAAHFHARYLALARRYRYVFLNSRARSALLAGRVTFWPRALDEQRMHAAAQALLGERDFSAFRDSECQSPTPFRNVSAIRVWRSGEFVVMDIRANAFLHHMVRNIAGTLAEVGQGKQPPEWVAEVLSSRQRRLAGMTAPADGLYFVGPEYPAEFGLPAPPEPWFPATMAS